MTSFEAILLSILGVVGLGALLVMMQLWRTLRSAERLMTQEVPRLVAEVTRLVSAVEANVQQMNATFSKLGETVWKAAEWFGPWVKAASFVNQAVRLIKGVKQAAPKRKT